MTPFKNQKYDAFTACASIGGMVHSSMTVIWPTLVGALFTTNVHKIGWLSCAVGGRLLCSQILGGLGIRFIPRMKIQKTVAAAIMVGFVAALATINQHEKNTCLLITTGAAHFGWRLIKSMTVYKPYKYRVLCESFSQKFRSKDFFVGA